MEELHRISKKGTIIKIIVPYYNSEHAFRDPTHVSFFTYYTFHHFTKRGKNNFYTKARFKIVSMDIIGVRFLPKSLLKKLSNYLPNLVTELRFKLEVLK